MRANRVFFPQAALDEWVSNDRIELSEDELVIRGEGRRYRIVEAVRVLGEETGGEDLHELTGKVKTVVFLTELGADLLGDSMVLGDLAYRVVPGFFGAPIGAFADHLRDPSRAAGPAGAGEPRSDEDLLAQYLLQNLE